MIDVKLTNSKLLERGTLIVSDFANVAYEAAKGKSLVPLELGK